jgi:hypothetical protein
MRLNRVQPAYFYERVQERTYACECGETDRSLCRPGNKRRGCGAAYLGSDTPIAINRIHGLP